MPFGQARYLSRGLAIIFTLTVGSYKSTSVLRAVVEATAKGPGVFPSKTVV